MKRSILTILKDGRWHGCSDFIHLGLSYRNRIGELREEGWQILSEKENGTVTYRYKLLNVPDRAPAPTPAPIPPQPAPVQERQTQLF